MTCMKYGNDKNKSRADVNVHREGTRACGTGPTSHLWESVGAACLLSLPLV